jgi:hypothetical protein
MNTEKLIRGATVVTVSIVTGIAAYVSYTHIYAVSHNPLLAFSIDGMIVTSTLVMMAANRARIETVWLAYVGLWLGIIATIAANIAYGYPHGLESAVWSTWPAICFVVSVETIAQLSRRKRRVRRSRDKPVTNMDDEGTVPIPAKLVNRKLVRANREAKPDPERTVKRTEMEQSSDPIFVVPPAKKVPGIKAIRNALSCGQPVAYKVQAIMTRDQVYDIHTAKEILDKEKANATNHTI